ncbi:MAG: AAA family ATPase, partial [Paramuribaculum sp.]|nr:AAA family ATPase [Paramuribaculum sp.]
MSKKDSSIVTVGQIDIDPKKFDKKPDYNALPVLATRDFVLFPGVTFPVQLGRESSLALAKAAEATKTPLGVICQKDGSLEKPGFSDIYDEGVIADVINVFEVPGAPPTAILRARGKFSKIEETQVADPIHRDTLYIIASPIREKKYPENDEELLLIASSVKHTITTLMKMNSDIPQEVFVNIENIDDPTLAINISATHAPIPPGARQKMLEEKNVKTRGLSLLSELHIQEEKIKIMQEIGEKTKAELSDQQRSAFLQQQYNALKKELFGEDGPEADIDRLHEKADSLPLPDDVRAVFDRECAKLGRLAPQSPDYSVLLSYLELIVDLPWGKLDATNEDIHKASRILDGDHYGLEKVKERVLEQIALLINAPESHSPIICLVGAPGVGKTSLGQSIASALGRKYRRVALGGLHDESEIRGHRRTYIGAMPGRIIDALRRAGSANPVILLDEIDKVGSDFRGDPSAALLEVLDPEQNYHFHDNYVDVDFDLSKVLFIATANNLSSIPAPLIDRMEVIDLSGYLPEEKIEIAKRHLLPRLLKDSGLSNSELKLDKNTILALIEEYTSESGVRQLEKRLASIVRKTVLAKVSGKEWNRIVKPSHLSSLLGPAPFIKEKYEGNEYPGVVTGL